VCAIKPLPLGTLDGNDLAVVHNQHDGAVVEVAKRLLHGGKREHGVRGCRASTRDLSGRARHGLEAGAAPRHAVG
jgi:hypothetical protein